MGQAKWGTLLSGTESAAHPTAVHSMKKTSHIGEAKDKHSHT